MSFHDLIAHFFLVHLLVHFIVFCTIYRVKDILIPSFGNYELSYNKYPVAGFCVDISSQLLWINTKEGIARSYGKKIGLQANTSGKELTCQWRRQTRPRFDPWVRKIPWRMKWQPFPVFLPGESHGQRSLVGYSKQGLEESDMTKTKGMGRIRCSFILNWKYQHVLIKTGLLSWCTG